MPCVYLYPYLLQLASLSYILLCCVYILSFLIATSWILIAFATDIKSDLNEINEVITDQIELKKKLFQCIKFHANAKQLSE